MAKKAYVFSALATDMRYTTWTPAGDAGLSVKQREIFIKGGTGVANDRLVTPQGVMTEIDEDDIPELEKNQVFALHVKNGFIAIQKKAADPEKIVADMNRADPSAPKTPNDFANQGENSAKPTGL